MPLQKRYLQGIRGHAVAPNCDGKEGVWGSSPQEGFPANQGFSGASRERASAVLRNICAIQVAQAAAQPWDRVVVWRAVSRTARSGGLAVGRVPRSRTARLTCAHSARAARACAAAARGCSVRSGCARTRRACTRRETKR